MKAATPLSVLAALLGLYGTVLASAAALAQTGPETGRGVEAAKPGSRIEAPDRRAEPGDKAPSEEGSAAQDEMQSVPGCLDGGRKLELIV